MTNTKSPKIHAAPGIYLVKLIEENRTVNIGTPPEKQILKGEIIDVGDDRTHDSGGELHATLQVGDTIFFYSYVNGADYFEENKEKYYSVLFNDARAYIEK